MLRLFDVNKNLAFFRFAFLHIGFLEDIESINVLFGVIDLRLGYETQFTVGEVEGNAIELLDLGKIGCQ